MRPKIVIKLKTEIKQARACYLEKGKDPIVIQKDNTYVIEPAEKEMTFEITNMKFHYSKKPTVYVRHKGFGKFIRFKIDLEEHDDYEIIMQETQSIVIEF